MRIYLIRHADPDYVNDTITPAGHLEAKALSKRLETVGLDKIYCSPLGRAQATMKYTTDLLDMPYKVEDWAIEIPGLTYVNEKGDKMAAWNIPGEVFRISEKMNVNNWTDADILKGTPVKAAYEKIVKGSDGFLASLGYERVGERYRIVKPNTDKIALFAHAGFGLTWLCHLLQLPVPLAWCGMFLAPTSVTTILFEERSTEWATPRCLCIGDVSHLYESGLTVSTAGIIANYY